MRRTVAVAVLMAVVLSPLLLVTDGWARAGGGSSGGSRGSRSYSSPSKPSSNPVSPSQPSSPPAYQSPTPARPGWGGMGGVLGGLLVGGLLGGLLFGGGMGSGIGLFEILIIAGLAWFAVSLFRRRQVPEPSGYAMAGGGSYGSDSSYGGAGGTAVMESPAGPTDLERGLGHIRQMDPGFDVRRVIETASDIFFRVQGAWMARDMATVADALTPEMQGVLQRDCDRLRAERKINRLENIAVRSAEVTEAWQENGQDYVTVHFVASLLDYTTDESGARVLEGSRTEPVKFEEYWTFVRPVGPSPFRVGAIQQP